MAKRDRLRAPRISLAAALAVLLVPLWAQATPDLNDQNIADAIEDRLDTDPGVFAGNVDIVSDHGVVTLTGTTPNLLSKERAAAIAAMVKGVRSVENRIVVIPLPPRSDKAVEGDVRAALLDDPATDSYEVAATVKSGVVTLTGTVASWPERLLAERVAKGVRGVIGIRNDLRVAFKEHRPDAEIKADIERALRRNVFVDGSLITVQVNNGKVTLSGTVGSAAEKARARDLAQVPGVSNVDDSDLQVARWARDEDLKRNKHTVKSEKEIRQAVEEALRWDPRVSSATVKAEVTGGTVTLRGTVDNLRAKRAAETDARETVGVTTVKNRLKVRPKKALNDAEIAAKIRDALKRNPYVERYKILVNVIGSVAYLVGDVDSFFEEQEAVQAAAAVRGVLSVKNHINVIEPNIYSYNPYLDEYHDHDYDFYRAPQPRQGVRTDAEIRETIKDRMSWNPFVDAGEVNVTVDHGVATLTGAVDTWAERDAATDDAYKGGATWVENDLRVRY